MGHLPTHVLALVVVVVWPCLVISADDFNVKLCSKCFLGLKPVEKVSCETELGEQLGRAITIDTTGCLKVKRAAGGDQGKNPIQCELELSRKVVGTPIGISFKKTLTFEPDASTGNFNANTASELEFCPGYVGFPTNAKELLKKSFTNVKEQASEILRNSLRKFPHL